jgi:hypothetical protein
VCVNGCTGKKREKHKKENKEKNKRKEETYFSPSQPILCAFTKYMVSFLFSFGYLIHDFKVISILNVYDFMRLKVF